MALKSLSPSLEIATAEPAADPAGRYFNRYSDPFNHFVYGSLNTSIDLMLH